MNEDDRPEGRVFGGPGITTGGNVTISDVSGQSAIGAHINQKLQNINQTDIKELRENLLEFQKGIEKLGLDPNYPNYQNAVNENISTAVIETKKDKPESSTIKQNFEAAIQTVKDTGRTISIISELYEPAKKIAKILGIATSFLL